MEGREAITEGYRFAGFHLVPRQCALLCEGSVVPLGARALSILIILVERHGRLVTKDEIMAAVWPGTVVEENNIWEHIKKLRKALPLGAITTIPGRGYQFTAEVELPRTGAAPPALPAPSSIEPARPGAQTNVPRGLADVIGREAELADLRERIVRHRLVTLTGPGGIGKTRLAIELGRGLVSDFPDGVWLIDLAPLSDPALVVSAAATVLGVVLRDNEAPVAAIAAAIEKRHLLLIVDNCEYLVGAAAELIHGLLERVAGLSVLVTSQEILGVPVEQIYRLDPLTLPPPGATDIDGYGAVALFVARAAAADRRFRLGPGNAAGIAEICRRLDGIPLALEMAASRVAMFGVEALNARLGDQLLLLGGAGRTAEARHRTLSATVEWSHGLLDAAEQRVFRRLAIFAGSFSLEAVAAVAGVEPVEVADTLGQLIDKSLVTVELGEPPRYRLLETLRLHAAAKLDASGERAACAELHAGYFTDLFDRADEFWETTPDAEWLPTYSADIDNVRAALEWATAEPDRTQIATALACNAGRLWDRLGILPEGRRVIDRLVERIDETTPRAAAARLLEQAGHLWRDGDRLRALDLHERSAELYRHMNDRLRLGDILDAIGGDHLYLGRHAEAKVALDGAYEILSTGNRLKSLQSVLNSLGILANNENQTAEAARCYGLARDLARKLKDSLRENIVVLNLGELEFRRGDVDRAIDYAREAAAGLRASGERSYLAWPLVNLASYLILRRDPAAARAPAEEVLALVRDDGGYLLWVCLQLWALLGALDGRAAAAARLIGFVDASSVRSGEVRQPLEQQIYDRLSEILAATLTPAACAAAAGEGAGWTEAQAVAFAIDHLIAPAGPGTD